MTDLIFDTSSPYAAGYYATLGKGIVDADGRPAGGISATLQTILSLMDRHNEKIGTRIDRMLFAWDGRSKNDKGRARKPPEYYSEMSMLRDIIGTVFGTVHGINEEAEGEDIVATAALRSTADRVIVVSSDKDTFQLHGGKIEIYSPHEKSLLPRHFITKKFGVKRPSQVCIALAILGDKADNIAGIHGWGPGKVAKLFSKVTDDMDLETCLKVIFEQIPEELRDGFLRDLDLTILDSGIPGIPEPAPIKLAEPDVVRDLGIKGIYDVYYRIFTQYTGRSGAESAESLLD